MRYLVTIQLGRASLFEAPTRAIVFTVFRISRMEASG
jgi:hypothetical protein